MPTVAEPLRETVAHPRPSTIHLAAHLDAALADLADRGIRPTPLNVIAHVLDCGVAEPIASQLAAMLEETRHAA